MIGTWHCLSILQTSWKARPLPTKHFIQTSISISNQRVVLYFFSSKSLQSSCRSDRHSALSLAPCSATYGKVKKGSAAQTMCFCCLFLSILLGWCSHCPTDNVFLVLKSDEIKHKLEKYPRGTKENVENICGLK